jgi:hypothetical protein
MNPDPAASKPEVGKEYFKQLPRSYLYFGYTTVVDLGVAVDPQKLEDFQRAPVHSDL